MNWDSEEPDIQYSLTMKNNPVPLALVGLVIGLAFGALGALTLRHSAVEEPAQKVLDRSVVLIGTLLLAVLLLTVLVIQHAF